MTGDAHDRRGTAFRMEGVEAMPVVSRICILTPAALCVPRFPSETLSGRTPGPPCERPSRSRRSEA